MEEKLLLQRKFYSLQRRALKKDEQWELVVGDFIKWGEQKRFVAPTAKPVRRIDPSKPWTISNLKVIETPRYYRTGYRDPPPVVEVTPTKTLTKAQWVAELRAATEVSDAK